MPIVGASLRGMPASCCDKDLRLDAAVLSSMEKAGEDGDLILGEMVYHVPLARRAKSLVRRVRGGCI